VEPAGNPHQAVCLDVVVAVFIIILDAPLDDQYRVIGTVTIVRSI
jgi:hypothetical protein